MKHKGGKGKKAPYSTVIMRIPTPIQKDVQILVDEFFKNLNGIKGVTSKKTEGVTSIEPKGVTGKEIERVTTVDDLNVSPRIKGVTGKKTEGVTSIEPKGVTGKEIERVTTVDDLNVSPRIKKILKEHKINLENLVKRTENAHMGELNPSIPGIGWKSGYQIISALHELNKKF